MSGTLAKEMARRDVIEAAYASARAAREQLGHLHGLTAALGEVTTRAQLVEFIQEHMMSALHADGIAVVELRHDGEHVTLTAHGLGADALARASLFRGPCPRWSSDRLVGAPLELQAYGLTPMTVGARQLGVMVLGFAEQRELTAAYRALVDDVARQLGLALDRAGSYERLERERERAESASRAKDEFLAMLGHELRNPLAPILTATQLMRLRAETLLDKERTVIERQVKHMIRLVDDLLEASPQIFSILQEVHL